jgi:hypothetical protein
MSGMKESRNVVKLIGVCAESDQFGIVMVRKSETSIK